jgi:hypothetical protein
MFLANIATKPAGVSSGKPSRRTSAAVSDGVEPFAPVRYATAERDPLDLLPFLHPLALLDRVEELARLEVTPADPPRHILGAIADLRRG